MKKLMLSLAVPLLLLACAASASEATIYYFVDPTESCIDYTAVQVAVATRDLPDHPLSPGSPDYAQGEGWDSSTSCFGLDAAGRFEVVFAGGGAKSVRETAWAGREPSHGERSRTLVDLGSCTAYYNSGFGVWRSSASCPGYAEVCKKVCGVRLDNLE